MSEQLQTIGDLISLLSRYPNSDFIRIEDTDRKPMFLIDESDNDEVILIVNNGKGRN